MMKINFSLENLIIDQVFKIAKSDEAIRDFFIEYDSYFNSMVYKNKC